MMMNYGLIQMYSRLKVRKMSGVDREPVIEIYDTDTDKVLFLSKWDIWHLWCDLIDHK